MKIIDAHTHPLFASKFFAGEAKKSGVTLSLRGLLREMKENGVEKAVAIGDWLRNDGTRRKPFSNFTNNDLVWLAKRERKRFRLLFAANIFLGYEHYYPTDDRCTRFYELAEKYRAVAVFHTGDPVWPAAKVRHAHPINVDDVAVERPKLKIVLAHAGQHWMRDAGVVVAKNKNVYADLSGWFLGRRLPPDAHVMKEMFRELVFLADDCDRLMFGSDWPLMRMKPYIEFINGCEFLSATEKKKIFWSNANKLYWGSE